MWIACLALKLAGMPERETESDQGRRKKQFMVIPPSTLLHFLNWLFTKNTLHKCCQGRFHYKHKDKADSGESAKGSCTVLYLIFAFHFLSEKIIPFFTRLPFPWQLTSAHIRFIVFSLFSFALHFGHSHCFYTALYILQWGNPERKNPNKHPKIPDSKFPGSCALGTELEVPPEEAAKEAHGAACDLTNEKKRKCWTLWPVVGVEVHYLDTGNHNLLSALWLEC